MNIEEGNSCEKTYNTVICKLHKKRQYDKKNKNLQTALKNR